MSRGKGHWFACRNRSATAYVVEHSVRDVRSTVEFVYDESDDAADPVTERSAQLAAQCHANELNEQDGTEQPADLHFR